MKSTVGIVGVGNMGGAMAAHLLDQGWPVQVCDLDAAKVRGLQALGAQGRSDPAGVAANCKALIVCVVDAVQTEEVLFGPHGAAAAMGPGQTVLLCPTIAPKDVEDFTRRLADRGIGAIDAPMSGGPARARDGTMSLMVACADAEFERHRALIDALSSKVFRISERPGDGSQDQAGEQPAGGHQPGRRRGGAWRWPGGWACAWTRRWTSSSNPADRAGSARIACAARSPATMSRARTSRLLQKDTRLAVEAALAAGFEGPLGPVARDVFARAAEAGLAELDDAALFRLLSK